MPIVRSLTAALCCLSCSIALSFEGRVLGPDGKPVAGARIQVLGRPGTTVSDRDGRFTLQPDPKPPFDLLVSLPDGVAVRPIPVDALPATGPLELRTELAFADEVTIVSGAAADLELPPAAAFNLTGRADIVQRGPQNLADITENIPGAGKVGDDHAAVPTLRGLAGGRTLILLDDGRVNAERRAGPSASFLDPFTIAEVEVIRGPGSVAYGSDAFGGVIRARTHIPGPGEPTTLRYAVAGASNVGERAANAEVGTTLLGGGLALGASYRIFDDYTDGNGDEVVNSGAEFKGVRLGWQRGVAGGNLRLLWRTDLARDVGKPAVDADVSQTFYPEEDSHRFTLHYDRPGPGEWSRLSLAASWDAYRLVTDRDRFATHDGRTPGHERRRGRQRLRPPSRGRAADRCPAAAPRGRRQRPLRPVGRQRHLASTTFPAASPRRSTKCRSSRLDATTSAPSSPCPAAWPGSRCPRGYGATP